MNTAKKAKKPVGLTAFDDIPAVASRAISPIKFPDSQVRKRVVIERPPAPPVLRTCPYCEATFEDYTKRHNTTYCRASCRVMMSRLKRTTAVAALARLTKAPLSAVEEMAERYNMGKLEQLLGEFGYTFDVAEKDWRP